MYTKWVFKLENFNSTKFEVKMLYYHEYNHQIIWHVLCWDWTTVGDKHVWYFGVRILIFGDDTHEFVEVSTNRKMIHGTLIKFWISLYRTCFITYNMHPNIKHLGAKSNRLEIKRAVASTLITFACELWF